MMPQVYGLPVSFAGTVTPRENYLASSARDQIFLNASVPPETVLPAYSIVKIDAATGAISGLASGEADELIGVTLCALDTEAGEDANVDCLIGGLINPRGVVWDATLSTLDAQKTAARMAKNASTFILQETL